MICRPFENIRAMTAWSYAGAAGVAAVAGVAILCNLPMNPFVKSPQEATLSYLSKGQLETLDGTKRKFQVIYNY